jgi:hypothetical protein
MGIATENTGEIQKKNRFSKGKSGNPKGKPKGARNRTTLMAERLFADEIDDVCKAVVAEAKDGNMQAAKIILERLFPPRKDSPIQIDLPKIENSTDLLKAVGCITDAVGIGQISPSEGEALARIVDIHIKALGLAEFGQRIAVLEKKSQ